MNEAEIVDLVFRKTPFYKLSDGRYVITLNDLAIATAKIERELSGKDTSAKDAIYRACADKNVWVLNVETGEYAELKPKGNK